MEFNQYIFCKGEESFNICLFLNKLLTITTRVTYCTRLLQAIRIKCCTKLYFKLFVLSDTFTCTYSIKGLRKFSMK